MPSRFLDDLNLSVAVDGGGTFGNVVIQGDNLLVLEALKKELAGNVKCAYLDPPYNTQSSYMTYPDKEDHAIWLSLMGERLERVWSLLTPDGVLLISIDDKECHYLKVLCDSLFGRSTFIASLVWHSEGNTQNYSQIIGCHEYILVYSKSGKVGNLSVVDPNIPPTSKLFKPVIRNTVVRNGPKNPPSPVVLPAGFPANFERGVIRSCDVRQPQYSGDITVEGSKTVHPVTAVTGWMSKNRLQQFIDGGFRPVLDTKNQETVFELTPTGAIEAVKKRGDGGHFLSVLRGFGTTNQMRLMLNRMGVSVAFSYPKPVDLISYLIEAFTGENDLILDGFAGSGTTGHAILQLNRKKGSRRRFLLIEVDAKTCSEVLVPRLKAVVQGHVKAGFPPHGGGFRFCRHEGTGAAVGFDLNDCSYRTKVEVEKEGSWVEVQKLDKTPFEEDW